MYLCYVTSLDTRSTCNKSPPQPASKYHQSRLSGSLTWQLACLRSVEWVAWTDCRARTVYTQFPRLAVMDKWYIPFAVEYKTSFKAIVSLLRNLAITCINSLTNPYFSFRSTEHLPIFFLFLICISNPPTLRPPTPPPPISLQHPEEHLI